LFDHRADASLGAESQVSSESLAVGTRSITSNLSPGATPSTSAEIDLESGAVPESRALRPFSEVSSISIGGVDVDVGAELSGERFLVLTASHGYGAKSHLPRVLKAEVTEPTNSPHCDQISGLRTGVL